MKERIGFFSAGFAFNRLNRMRFYEQILPEGVDIFLITTNRWKGLEKDKYQFEWTGLKRTKVQVLDYNCSLPIKMREFCMENNLKSLINLGHMTSYLLLYFCTIFSRTKFISSWMGFIPDFKNFQKNISIRKVSDLFYFYSSLFFAKKIIFNDYELYSKINTNLKKSKFNLFKNIDTIYLPPPVDTNLFTPMNKEKARKVLHLKETDKIIIFVGRIEFLKGSDILIELIKRNKDIIFIVIGKVIDENFNKVKSLKNVRHFAKKDPDELKIYYNAANLSFLLHRIKGGGLAQTVHESLACGVPAIIPTVLMERDTPSLIKISNDGEIYDTIVYDLQKTISKINLVIKKFFKLTKKEELKINREAREYALRELSFRRWRKSYIKAFIR